MWIEKRKDRTVYIPTSSMADIAFLLITFFLVTTSLDLDKGLSLTLPSEGGKKMVNLKTIACLYINDAGNVMLDKEEIEISMIKEAIINRLNERPQLIVSIRTCRNTKYQFFISVLDQVQMAECRRISIAEHDI